jgi:rhamnosyltransferase
VKTCCVIVCYRPEFVQVRNLCIDLASDHARVILVDNTESPSLSDKPLPSGCTLITLGSNTGIAHAQNVGIEASIAAGADIVAFFDQDSKIAPGFLHALVSPLRRGIPEVVSPLYFDDTTRQELPSLSVSRHGMSNAIHRRSDRQPYPVDVVISSGTAATKEVFSIAGLLDESFFIDFVDTEWCLRCRGKGIPIRVIPDAVMHHRIGSRVTIN